MKYIVNKLLNDKNVMSLFMGKPFNFNNKLVSLEDIKDSYETIQKDIGYQFKKIKGAKQEHTNIVKIIKEENLEEEFNGVDGLITDLKGVALVTKVADCQALLFYDQSKKVIANVHAGWKGTLNKIVKNAISLMMDEFGCKGEDIVAYISPSIRKCCFEVDDDVKDMFLKNFSNIEEDIYLGKIRNNKQKYFIDTVNINKKELLKLGLKEENIEISNYCTMCNHDKFHSYRVERDFSGRNLALICLK